MKRLLLTVLLLAAACSGCLAQGTKSRVVANDKTRVLIILDCSNSMWDRWQSDAKIKVTQTVLLKFLDSVANQPNIEVALRVFGHLNKNAYGTRLEVPFEAGNNYKIQSKIKTLVPNGECTAATALSNSLNDFPATGASRNIILIITDGMDDCDGNICDVARQVQMSGVIVQTFILGIGSRQNFQHSLDCAGKFTHVPNEEQYTETLYDIFRISEEEAQLVVSVSDETHHLYETEIPLALYDSQTGVVKYTTIYSVDSKYTPDTLVIDPLVAYDIVLHTMPETRMEGLLFTAGRVNRLNITIEQGSLKLRTDGMRTNYQVPQYPILVRQHGRPEILNTQYLGDECHYKSGEYDLEVLCQPVLRLDGVVVANSSATDLRIPTPGQANITKPKEVSSGTVFALRDGELTRVCDLNPNKINERLLLMPGEYQLVVKPQSSTSYESVKTIRFQIGSGKTTNINLQP